jgi:hypothetical protein
MNLYKSILSVLVLLIFTVSGFSQTKTEIDIIRCCILHFYGRQPNDTIFNRKGQIKRIKTYPRKNIVLINETVSLDKILGSPNYIPDIDSISKYRKLGLSQLDSTSFNDFFSNNKIFVRIDSLKGIDLNIFYFSKSKIDKIFKVGGWDNYNKIYGYTPIFRISRPGINNKEDKAFIYCNGEFDGLDGWGEYLLLIKVNGEWFVKESMLVWIS